MTRSYDKKDEKPVSYSIFNCFEYIDDNDEYNIRAFNSVQGSFSEDINWYDMTWAFVLYVPAVGTETPSPLLFKTIFGIEIQPVAGSMLQAVCKDSPLYDQQALRLASMMRQQMPDSLPASANDFSSFLGAAVEWVPKIWGAIKGIFSPKTTPQEAKAIAHKEVVEETPVAPIIMRAAERPIRKVPARQYVPSQQVAYSHAVIRPQAAPRAPHSGKGSGKVFRKDRSNSAPAGVRQQTGAQNVSGSAPIPTQVYVNRQRVGEQRKSRSRTPRPKGH
jgi:hypothetical protein